MEEKVQAKSTEEQSSTVPSDQSAQTNNVKNIVVISLVILVLLIGGAMLLFSHKNPSPQAVTNNTQVSSKPTPVISPVTQDNVDQTLNSTDTTLKQSIDQANTDLNSISSIDKSQDSTSGL